jgi:hypothetical protein
MKKLIHCVIAQESVLNCYLLVDVSTDYGVLKSAVEDFLLANDVKEYNSCRENELIRFIETPGKEVPLEKALDFYDPVLFLDDDNELLDIEGSELKRIIELEIKEQGEKEELEKFNENQLPLELEK